MTRAQNDTRAAPIRPRRGFSLFEILASLAVVTLLTSIVISTLTGRLDEAKAVQTAVQLQQLTTAVRQFRLDVGHWPRQIAQLTDRPGTGTAGTLDLLADPIPAASATRWDGPYLDLGVAKGDSLPLPGGGVIVSPFTTRNWGGDTFVVIRIARLSRTQARGVSRILDGDTVVSPVADDRAGRVRWRRGTNADTLVFFADPVDLP